ncbi:6-carboxyhexanoate-CoA ligase [Tumebacillus sp. BK434]|uniref:6-carboxyhexanoate--CoA ligase n=1 Tax=Tumebacillus sp. BK434 TaxID=2512169 RepID=UPI001043AE69|nr:6-carboxyhexanoate--CoA ligase [Tumebacillus sp. BK434]TCP53827.1 6-carboxyhexanoate-CoA ligase [Tumebacillus sp. BK434]
MDDYYSVRMRAADGGAHEAGGRHISGGERLVCKEELEAAVQTLLRRAMTHELGQPDFVNLTVEKVARADIGQLEALPISQRVAHSVAEGHAAAVELLVQAGVALSAAQKGVALLVQGPAPDGGVMRGAVVMDADTGARLERDPGRGVRVAQHDWAPDALARWKRRVEPLGLDQVRVAEALALATKVAAQAGTVAELCWSDDPGYVGGYVAAATIGYVRIAQLKEPGSPLGGRVFFVRGVRNVQDYEAVLAVPVLIEDATAERGVW